LIIKLSTVLIACLVLVGCASTPAYHQQWTEVTSHLPDTDIKGEHDSVETADGIKTDFYPNRKMAQQIVYRFPQGGMIDTVCVTHSYPCGNWSMRITGFRPGHMPAGWMNIPEGTYTLTPTSDPYVEVMKNEDQLTVGYWAVNRHGRGAGVVRTYPEAQTVTNLE
jgi:hypothetical protein